MKKIVLQYGLIGSILALTLGLYVNSLTHDFVNWDDNAYVTENPAIRDFSAGGMTALFLRTFQTAELSFTIFSFALDYHLWKLNPFPYHLENLLLHLLNVMLVFLVVRSLTRRSDLALLTTLLFAIHPFRVESVAWVTQRKDVLYAGFYLSGLLGYLAYIRNHRQRRYLILAILLFIGALLSKDAALTFLFALVLIDYYRVRPFSAQIIFEKLPFALLTTLRLWNHYLMPHTVEPLIMPGIKAAVAGDLTLGFHLLDRVFLGCYALAWYILGLFAPIHLAVIHPFPVKNGNFLPLQYYASPVFLLFVWIVLVLFFKHSRSRKDIVFGGMFFLIMISISLHIVPIGGVSLVAERYAYLASIGFCFLVSQTIAHVLSNRSPSTSQIKPYVIALLVLYCMFLSIATYQRIGIWKNSTTLWTDEIDKHPEVAISYNSRGYVKEQSGDYEGALEDYNTALARHPDYVEAHINRGNVRDKLGDYQGALEDFNDVLALSPRNPNVYNNRGVMKGILGEYHAAIDDFNQAIALDPENANAYINRGNAHAKTGNETQALADFSHAISLNPDLTEAYYNRAILYIKSRQCPQALRDMEHMHTLGRQISQEFLNFFHQTCQ